MIWSHTWCCALLKDQLFQYLIMFDLKNERSAACISIYLSIYLPTYLPIYLSVYLSIYLSIYLHMNSHWSSHMQSHPIDTLGKRIAPIKSICLQLWHLLTQNFRPRVLFFGLHIMMYHDWLVVWLPFFIFPIYWVANHPNWLSYFSEGWPNHQPDDVSWFVGGFSDFPWDVPDLCIAISRRCEHQPCCFRGSAKPAAGRKAVKRNAPWDGQNMCSNFKCDIHRLIIKTYEELCFRIIYIYMGVS